MSLESEKTALGDQVPQDDVRVLGARDESHAVVVETDRCDGCLVAVERERGREREVVFGPLRQVEDTQRAVQVADGQAIVDALLEANDFAARFGVADEFKDL